MMNHTRRHNNKETLETKSNIITQCIVPKATENTQYTFILFYVLKQANCLHAIYKFSSLI
jgi:hypothetical protein